MNNKFPIAILGGMGPKASEYLYKLLIDLAIKDFGAKNNDDFPEVILYSIPVPDFISNDQAKKKALDMLKQRVKHVNKLNISCISIACNTAHILLPELQAVSKVPFVSIIDAVVENTSKSKVKTVGILGTPSTLRYKLYQTSLKDKGIRSILPSERQVNILEEIIRGVLEGKDSKYDQKRLSFIANSLKAGGAEGIILGCTELPLIFPLKYSLPVYNCVQILAMALLLKYYKQNTI